MAKSKQSAIDSLIKLGLSSGEARTYTAMVGLGSTHASTIARQASIPQPKIYGYLSQLESRGFITRHEKKGVADTFVAVSYELVLETLKKNIDSQISNTLDYFEETKKSQKTREIEDLFAYYEGEKAVYTGLQKIIERVRENVYLGLLNEDQGSIIKELLKNQVKNENIKVYVFEFKNQAIQPPFLKSFLKSKGFNQFLKEKPCLFFTDLNLDKFEARSLNFVLPSVGGYNCVLLDIKHPLIFRIQIQLVKSILDSLNNSILRIKEVNLDEGF